MTPARLVAKHKFRNIVELGTGQGAGGAEVMKVLPLLSQFTTVNYDYPANQVFGEFLQPWLNDVRLKILVADTLDPATLELVPSEVDFLIIDSHHEAWHAAAELELWQSALVDGALVFVDDLEHNDMRLFWNTLPYFRWVCNTDPLQGVFRYDAQHRYRNTFPRGKTPKELAC